MVTPLVNAVNCEYSSFEVLRKTTNGKPQLGDNVVKTTTINVIGMSLVAFAVALSCPAFASAGEPPQEQVHKPTLVINLTSGQQDLHAVVMGLHFAEHGLADGREVVVFFNVKSPPLAKKALDDSVKFRDMPPVREMVAGLLKQGARMVVCPMCAEITGITTEELAPGIEMIEDRKQVFDHLHGNSVVFTY